MQTDTKEMCKALRINHISYLSRLLKNVLLSRTLLIKHFRTNFVPRLLNKQFSIPVVYQFSDSATTTTAATTNTTAAASITTTAAAQTATTTSAGTTTTTATGGDICAGTVSHTGVLSVSYFNPSELHVFYTDKLFLSLVFPSGFFPLSSF